MIRGETMAEPRGGACGRGESRHQWRREDERLTARVADGGIQSEQAEHG